MKNIVFLIALLSITCILGCGKKSSDDAPYVANGITLDVPEVAGRNVVVKWTKTGKADLAMCQLYRRTDSVNGGWMGVMIDVNAGQYIDTLSTLPYVQYYMVTVSKKTQTEVQSNGVTYVRNDIDLISILPKDALFDRDGRVLYVYSGDGDILAYDIATRKTLKKVSTGCETGFCALGAYNGKKELYVARKDGWVFVYDAATLTQTAQLNIGIDVYSVQYANGKLFVSHYVNPNTLEVFDRATMAKIWGESDVDLLRMIAVPGTNTQMLCASAASTRMYRYLFNSVGLLVNKQMVTSETYGATPEAFELFPDGNRIITSQQGTILNANMGYVSALPRGSMAFSSFDFGNTAGQIYAGCRIRAVQAYAISDYQLVKTTATIGYPVKVFYDNGSVICISTLNDPQFYYPADGPQAFVERVSE